MSIFRRIYLRITKDPSAFHTYKKTGWLEGRIPLKKVKVNETLRKIHFDKEFKQIKIERKKTEVPSAQCTLKDNLAKLLQKIDEPAHETSRKL